MELAFAKDALDRENRGPLIAVVGYALFGAVVGGLSVGFFPARVLSRPSPIPGLSVLLCPLGAGIAMEAWGRWRRAHGHATTNLGTWFGGASFAFAASLVRYLGVGR